MSETKPVTRPRWQRALITLSAVVTIAFVIALLYWMRSVFVPIALAMFFTSVLAPVVTFLQRRGLGRLPAVITVVVVAAVLFAGTAYVLIAQIGGLTETLSQNKDHITAKLDAGRKVVLGDGESKWAKTLKEWEQTILPAAADETPKTVVVEPSPSWYSRLNSLSGPVVELLATVAFALVLVVFMLVAKEDLQDRVLRVFGMGSVASAVRASGETTSRISRFLLAQFLLNVTFGVLCTIGLLVMGVKYALLWGLLATVMRYVPYLGTWIGVIPPTVFAAALSDGWWQPVGVLVLFLGLELLSNNLVEPRLYGTSLGVSEVGYLISAAVWAFLWGPIGLILSGPLTTFLVVLGKHVPALRNLAVLLSSDPPVTPAVALFQRLAARNQDEALRVIEEAIPADDPRGVFDATVIPALSLVKQARHDGQFDADEEREVMAVADEVVEDTVLEVRRRTAEGGGTSSDARKVRVLACPAADIADRLSLEALAGMLPADRWEVKVSGVATLTSELLAEAEQFGPDVICIAALPPNGAAHTRYLCKRLRARFPDAHILVGWWGESTGDTTAIESAGASAVVNSLTTARQSLVGWLPVFNANAPKVDAARPPQGVAIGTLPA